MPTKTCWKCHTEMDASVFTCPRCAARVGIADAHGVGRKPPRVLVWVLTGLGGLLLLLVVGISLLVSWGERLNKQQDADRAAVAQKIQTGAEEALRCIPAKDQIAAAEDYLKQEEEGERIAKKYLYESMKNPDAKAPNNHLFTKDEDAAIRTRLGYVTPDQPEYSKEQALLKQMDELQKRAEADNAVWEGKMKVVARKDYAKQLEDELVNRRMNVDVTASGKDNTILTIRYVLASKVVAHDLSESGIIGRAREQGFKTVRLTNGYEGSWEWDLTKSE